MSLVPNIKYKTEYCLYWQEGKVCEKGNYCFFAHGEQELRTIEENHRQIILRNSQEGQTLAMSNNYKTVFCKFYAQGQCKLGEKCTFAHQRREKKKKKPPQQYRLEVNYTENYWEMPQNYEYYNHYYYQQFYQNYVSQPNYVPPEINLKPQFQPLIENQNHQFDNEKNEDMAISSQQNKTITQINRNQTKKYAENLQSPEHAMKMSPNSAKTESSAKVQTPEDKSSLASLVQDKKCDL